MDPIQHQIHKLLADRTHQPAQQQQQPPEMPPPPYEASDSDSEDDEDDEPSSQPLKLTIDAAHTIKGSNNLVPTSPTAITDATKLSVVLLQAISKLNAAATDDAAGSRKTLKVDLTINCGINIIGDRNVVGNVGLRPKSPTVLGLPSGGVDHVAVGVKRKVDVDENHDGEPEPKRIAVKREQDCQ